MYVEHKNSVIRSTVHRLDGSAINSKPPIGLAHVDPHWTRCSLFASVADPNRHKKGPDLDSCELHCGIFCSQ